MPCLATLFSGEWVCHLTQQCSDNNNNASKPVNTDKVGHDESYFHRGMCSDPGLASLKLVVPPNLRCFNPSGAISPVFPQLQSLHHFAVACSCLASSLSGMSILNRQRLSKISQTAWTHSSQCQLIATSANTTQTRALLLCNNHNSSKQPWAPITACMHTHPSITFSHLAGWAHSKSHRQSSY